ncbi:MULTISPECIES: hypothetical protein [Cellulomonas]|uniref:Uncharacterized protein n=1 Tax=Cellulomonas iranensis TaxID=76862 RepID=A0ABU0GMA3_9CELL|nr:MULTISPECIES: hypothetical protein [Cellulomonas]MDQ0426496.1 hypothetical protein [Cellulomonas iranensis]TFH74153.1 hypothetical protein E4A51_01465 [Cellulomonas sp. HD19AZ1]
MSEPSTRATWHADLARHDQSAHRRMAERAATTAEPLLQQRFDAVTAELHVLRAAVARRDALLREQTAALREREAYVRELEARLESTPRSASGTLRGVARRVRRRVGRLVRAALSQR